MLDRAELICFVTTADTDRSKAFYRDTLGLTLLRDDGYALIFDANGRQLRVQRVEAVKPHPYTALGWGVSDLAATVRALVGAGVTIARFPGLPLGPDGIWDTPDGSRVAWLLDPDGNVLSLSQAPAR